MILVCGDSTDPITRFFCQRLDSYKAEYRLLDLNGYPSGYNIIHHRRADGAVGSISFAGWSIRVEELTGVFVRNMYDPGKQVDDRHGQAVGVALDAELNLGLETILAGLTCPVVNPFAAAWSNQSKPYQALHIQNLGFRIPATLITNDLNEARRFYDEMDGDIICKSASWKTVGTRRVDIGGLPALMSGRRSPSQFQERVPGIDIRVHVVGDQIFPTKVISDFVDYRFEETEQLRMEIAVLPSEIATACIRLTQRLGLLLSGIDLRQTPDGRFYCFEVNTQPGFAFYEQRTGQPISRALWQLLVGK